MGSTIEVEAFGAPLSNVRGTTKTLDTTSFDDAELKKEVLQYVSELTGGVPLNAVPGREGYWFAKLPDGKTTINMRSESSSKVSRWTVDIAGNDELLGVIYANRNKVEVKFK